MDPRGISPAFSRYMPDFHEATIKFVNVLLKEKQLQLDKAAHTPGFADRLGEFEGLKNRLLLEIVYATVSGEGN